MSKRLLQVVGLRSLAVRYWAWILAVALLAVGLFCLRLLEHDASAEWTVPAAAARAWPAGGRLFFTSVALAACALVLALVFGFPVGVHLGRQGGIVLTALVLVPLAFPPQLSAYVWRFLLEDVSGLFGGAGAWWRSPRWSFFGAAWTLAAVGWPVVALPVAVSMRLRGTRLEEELATLARPRAVFWGAVVPGLLPGLLAGAGVFFLLALSNYGVPLMWNVPSQNVAVFARLAAFYSPGEALVLALPLQVTALALSALGLLWLSRRPYGLDLGETQVTAGGRVGSSSRPLAVLSGLVLLVTIALPAAAFVAGPRPLAMLKTNLLAGGSSYVWGLVLSGLGATGATLLGWVLATMLRRARRGVVAVVELVGLTALFVPAAVVCMMLAGALAGPNWLSPLYDSVAVFVLAYGLRYFYIPYRMVRFVQRLEGREYRDLQRLLGLGMLRRLTLTAWGVFRPAIIVSWLIVFVLVLGELEIATFLAQPGRQPISVFLDNLMHYGRSAAVSQWAIVVVATEVVIACTVLAVGLNQWRKWQVRT